MAAGDVARLILAVIIVAAALALVWSARRKPTLTDRRLDAAHRYLRERRLPTDVDTVLLTTRLLAAGLPIARCLIAGCLVVLGGLFVFWPYLPGDALFELAPLLLIPAGFLAAVARSRALRRTASPPAGAPRVAHGSPARLADCAPPLLRWWPAISVTVAGLVVALYLVAPADDAKVAPGMAVGRWAIAALLVPANLVLARWLVARPQPATTPAELALRNEFTAETVSLMLALPGAGLVVGDLPTSAWSYLTLLVTPALLAIPYLAQNRCRRWVRERLWTPRVPVPGT